MPLSCSLVAWCCCCFHAHISVSVCVWTCLLPLCRYMENMLIYFIRLCTTIMFCKHKHVPVRHGHNRLFMCMFISFLLYSIRMLYALSTVTVTSVAHYCHSFISSSSLLSLLHGLILLFSLSRWARHTLVALCVK